MDPAANLAANVKALRETRGLTQSQMAKAAELPRPTWANLETGAANPTLSVLMKVAGALQVTLEELVGAPRASARLYRASELPQNKRGKAIIRRLLPDPIPGLELERMEFPPGAAFAGVPHTAGTREYFTCESGSLELSAGGERWQLEPGDVVVFRGDQRHGYRNPGRDTAVAYSAVSLSPSTE